jgi:hypothetical protein
MVVNCVGQFNLRMYMRNFKKMVNKVLALSGAALLSLQAHAFILDANLRDAGRAALSYSQTSDMPRPATQELSNFNTDIGVFDGD